MTGRTEIRVREIRRRTRRYRRRRENRELFSLTAFGLFLLAGISVLLQGVQAPGVSAVAARCCCGRTRARTSWSVSPPLW